MKKILLNMFKTKGFLGPKSFKVFHLLLKKILFLTFIYSLCVYVCVCAQSEDNSGFTWGLRTELRSSG